MIGAQLTLNGLALTPVGTANGAKKKQFSSSAIEALFSE
jgi:hypothetical protein